MVNGELYEKWIKSEFPKVSEEYQKLRSGPNITNLIEEKTSEYNGAKLSEDTYEPIWEKYDQLQNAFSTLSDSLKGLHTRVTEVKKERCAGKEEAMEQSVALDKKVCMFMETITKDVDKKLSSLRKDINTQFIETRKAIGQFKINIQRQINAFKETPLHKIQDLETSFIKVKEEISKIDLEGLAASYNNERELREEIKGVENNPRDDMIHVII